MYRKGWLILIFISSIGIYSFAQKPQMPTLNYLTINPTNGNPTIYWTPPQLNIPTFPNPTGYIIYKRIIDNLSPSGRNEPIDTVGPNVYSYTDIASNGNVERLTYLVASNGPTEPSQLTRVHSNTFVTAKYDSCNHKIDLEWQQYEGWGNQIDSIFVYVGNTNNWTTFPIRHSILGTKNKDTINVRENQDYFVYIVSKRKGSPTYFTTSNLYYKFTDMPIHPTYMSVDSILAEDKKINLYFKIDPTTELTKFQVVRWEQPDSIKSLFSSKILHTFTDPTLTFFADTVDSWAARTRPFYYKVDAINSCPIVVKVTNHSNSITPVVQNKGMKNIIQWDTLHIDKKLILNSNNIVSYRVTRYAYDNNTSPIAPVIFPETSDLQITDDVTDLEGLGYSINFCYQIEAIERNTANTIVMLSRSRIQCTEIIPGVIMPDAIMPNSSISNYGNSRNILVPIITFKANYTLNVYNRWGSLVFTGENQGWDGRESNGRLVKEGTYIYRLTVHTIGNRSVIKTGSVTVVYQ
ncbi:MAG: gliding motility-associated C-terminal domain-containing protein [Tenuifilaceae bacterium]